MIKYKHDLFIYNCNSNNNYSILCAILLSSDIQTATFLTTIISCILTYVSSVIALLAIVSAIKSNRPRIIVKPKKKYQHETICLIVKFINLFLYRQ